MHTDTISALALALGLFAAIFGTMSFFLSVYTLILVKSRPTRPVIREIIDPYTSQEHARDITAGDPTGRPAPADNLGMPETYDAEKDEDEQPGRRGQPEFYDEMGI